MRGTSAAHTSKLVISVPTAPLAKSSTAATWVGARTVIIVPYFGWLEIMRSGKLIWAEAVTRRTGPSMAISVVR